MKTKLQICIEQQLSASSPEDKPHTCSPAKSIKKDTIRNEQEATRLRTTPLAGDTEEECNIIGSGVLLGEQGG